MSTRCVRRVFVGAHRSNGYGPDPGSDHRLSSAPSPPGVCMRRIIGILAACLALIAGSVGIATSASAATEPVVFVHGFGGNGSNFDSLEAHLRANGWSDSQFFEF